MYKLAIEQFLKSQKISYEVSGDQIKCRCLNPKHIDSNPSFQFNTSKGFGHCFSCGFKTHISHLSEVEIDPETLRQYEYDKLIEQLHVGTTEIAEQDVILPPKAFDITWEVRGISAEFLQELEVYYCERGKYCGRLIFPIKGVNDELLGYTSWIANEEALGDFKDRLVPPTREHAKYLHSYGLKTADVIYPTTNESVELKIGQGLHLTEGLFDALSLLQLGYPAICNFGLGAPSFIKIGEVFSMGYTELVPAFDNDKAGLEGWQAIRDEWARHMKILGPSAILKEIRGNGFNDANDYLLSKLKGLRHV